MEQIKAITIGDTQYNVAQASAVEQQKIMLLIGAKIALNSATSKVEQIDAKLLTGAFLTLPESTFTEVASIVLRKTVISGETNPLDVASFQGNMMGYFTLVAEAVCFNLNDFFTWLDSENAASRGQ